MYNTTLCCTVLCSTVEEVIRYQMTQLGSQAGTETALPLQQLGDRRVAHYQHPQQYMQWSHFGINILHYLERQNRPETMCSNVVVEPGQHPSFNRTLLNPESLHFIMSRLRKIVCRLAVN